MVLETVKGSDNIPKGKVRLSEEEVLKIQKSIVNNWPNFWDVCFLKYGRYLATTATFITSGLCINVFHPILKFGTGTFTAVLPSLILSPGFVLYKQEKILTNDILMLKKDCPVCQHAKFLALQLYTGLVFPGLLGMLHANKGRDITCDVTNTREYWRKTANLSKSNGSIFKGVFVFQSLFAFALPYLQQMEIIKLLEKINSENPVEEISEEIL